MGIMRDVVEIARCGVCR